MPMNPYTNCVHNQFQKLHKKPKKLPFGNLLRRKNQLNITHRQLKTIATYNAINAKQDVIDVTPQNTKQLTST